MITSPHPARALLLLAMLATGCVPTPTGTAAAVSSPDPLVGRYELDSGLFLQHAEQAGVPVPAETRALLGRMRQDLVLHGDGTFTMLSFTPKTTASTTPVMRAQGTWQKSGSALLMTPRSGSRDGAALPAAELKPLRAEILPEGRLHVGPADGVNSNPFLLRRR